MKPFFKRKPEGSRSDEGSRSVEGGRASGGKAEKAVKISILGLLVLLAAAAVFTVIRAVGLKTGVIDNGISAEELIKKYDRASVLVVYGSEDVWAENVAGKVTSKLSSVDSLEVRAVPDSGYDAAADAASLTVLLGYTSQNEESYFDAWLRLGPDGWEIARADGGEGDGITVSLLAMSEEAAIQAADRFTDYFAIYSRLNRFFGTMYRTSVSEKLPQAPVFLDQGAGVLVISRPSVGGESLKAIESLIGKTSPSAVIFNGGLDCGKTDPAEIREAWTAISEQLDSLGTRWFCIEGPDGSELAAVSKEAAGIIADIGGKDVIIPDEGRWLISAKDGVPEAAVLAVGAGLASGYPDTEGPSPGISAFLAAMRRGAGRDISAAAVFPGLVSGILEAYTSELTSGELNGMGIWDREVTCLPAASSVLMGELAGRGFSDFVFYAGNNNISAVKDCASGAFPGISFALCGCADYSSYGLGGRYAFHNSLRGGAFLALEEDAGEDGKRDFSPEFVLAPASENAR